MRVIGLKLGIFQCMKRSFKNMSTSCKAIVAPSVLAADFANLAHDCDEVVKGECITAVLFSTFEF